jgi:hypothetical protein
MEIPSVPRQGSVVYSPIRNRGFFFFEDGNPGEIFSEIRKLEDNCVA